MIKAAMRPSGVTAFVARLQSVDPGCSIQAHAGAGVVIARFNDQAAGDFSKALIRELQPSARAADGSVVVLSYPDGAELTRAVVWGPASPSAPIMRAVKRQFDPKGLLNPGRFVYD